MPLRLIIAFFSIVISALPLQAQFDTRATAAYVFDMTTDTVLMATNANVPVPPASMSKLMTIDILFEALQDGRVTLDTEFGVSAKAAKMGGSKMFLREGSRVTVENLIQGIVVQSGNDACVVVAEGLAGTEEAFARLMNERAKALGMTSSTFANASGWPDPNQRMSMRDLGFLASRIITKFPEYYGYFSEKEFTWDGITQQNRNPLLNLGIGADGLKTGHTQEAGYGLVGSATQAGRRVVFAISGLQSESARAEEGERIVNWSFRQFTQKTVVKKDTVIADIPVWMGEMGSVGAVPAKDISLLVPASINKDISAEITYQGPIEAPIKAGDQIAVLNVKVGDLAPREIPLVAQQDIARGGFLPRLRTAVKVLLREFSARAAAN